MSELTARPFSNADLAREIANAIVLLAKHQSSLAQGMWNPHFCSAEAVSHAQEIAGDLRTSAAWIDRRIAMDALAKV